MIACMLTLLHTVVFRFVLALVVTIVFVVAEWQVLFSLILIWYVRCYSEYLLWSIPVYYGVFSMIDKRLLFFVARKRTMFI
jgi:hypothetical protein